MDIKKYLTNKDIELSNEDINFEKLEKDIRKGYVSSDEIDSVRDEINKEWTSKYTTLEDEKNNLVRVNDILSELEKQVEPLEKQSEKAKVYLKKKEELKKLDVNMFTAINNSLINDGCGLFR